MRVEKVIKLQDTDRELTFKIRQMPAWHGLMWGERMGLALGKAPNFFSLLASNDREQQAGAIIAALCSGVQFEEVEPLQRELLACCSRIDAGVEQLCTPETIEGYIDSPRTLYDLLVEALKVNTSFFQSASPSSSLTSETQDLSKNNRPAQSPIRMSAGS